MQNLKLTRLSVYPGYTPKGSYNVTVEFEGDAGKIELNCDAGLGDAIVKTCADEIVRHAREAAEQMALSVLETNPVKEIEHAEPLPLGDDDEDIPF